MDHFGHKQSIFELWMDEDRAFEQTIFDALLAAHRNMNKKTPIAIRKQVMEAIHLLDKRLQTDE